MVKKWDKYIKNNKHKDILVEIKNDILNNNISTYDVTKMN
jgi:hypothetical protein